MLTFLPGNADIYLRKPVQDRPSAQKRCDPELKIIRKARLPGIGRRYAKRTVMEERMHTETITRAIHAQVNTKGWKAKIVSWEHVHDLQKDACPSRAIDSDRFLIHAERCITFHNERPGAFPGWLNASWHNSLVGCMVCQNNCPVNRKLMNRSEDGPIFFEEETAALLQGVSRAKMPPAVIDKVVGLDIFEYVDVLGRNLRALLQSPQEGTL
jgi:hypothetical protein